MTTRSSVMLISILIAFVGCSTGSNTELKDGVPIHISRVEYIAYDQTKRPMVTKIDLLDAVPSQPHKVIALITCEGSYREEVVMTDAIIYKAKQLGADAVVRIDPIKAVTGGGSMYGGSHSTRCLFRGQAIVYDARP